MRAAVTDSLPTAKPEMKPWIAAIHAYVPGKSKAADGRPLVKLSANENPLGTSPAALAARANAGAPALYPDPDSVELREALGALHAIDPARIVCGTGSDELLNLAAQAFAGPGDEVLYVRYGFAVYDIAARRCGASVVVAPDSDFGTDVDALLGSVTERTRVVFLANPNNPTGSFLPNAELARLHAGLPGNVLLVIDQAYAEYVAAADDDGGLALAAAHDNVLVTRAPTHEILSGITRAAVLELAKREGLKVEFRAFSVAEAQAAKEAFVSSATSYVIPVVSLDGKPIGNGGPGVVASKLRSLYEAHAATHSTDWQAPFIAP